MSRAKDVFDDDFNVLTCAEFEIFQVLKSKWVAQLSLLKRNVT